MPGIDQRQDSGEPKVSILLPNLNSLPFLEERMQTIFDQTLTDWELIIVDSYSDDGSWEFFQEYAKEHTRLRISQAPREGVYAGLNACIRLARGQYVYVATSDDTMTPDCLEKMVAALEGNPDCGMAVCCLRIIDETGNVIEGTGNGLGGNQALGDRLKVMHTRYPPYDTIVTCAWAATYASLTQLLIRRSALERIGHFRTDFGNWGDFEWNVRSSLLTPRVYVPEFLATWRRRQGQATQEAVFSTPLWPRKAIEMIRSAYQTASEIDPNSVGSVALPDLLRPRIQEVVGLSLSECAGIPRKVLKLFVLFFEYPQATLTCILHRIMSRRFAFGPGPQPAHKLLSKAGLLEPG